MLEDDIQKQANADLRSVGIPYLHLPKRVAKLMPEHKGFPDLVVFPGGGVAMFYELKNGDDEKLNAKQLKFRDKAQQMNYPHFIIRSMDQWQKAFVTLYQYHTLHKHDSIHCT